jgi:hypothetical protein
MPKFLADEEQQWVHFAPPELINRQSSEWQGLRADVVTAVRQTWAMTAGDIRARDVRCGASKRKTPVRNRGFRLCMNFYSQNLQGGKSRL